MEINKHNINTYSTFRKTILIAGVLIALINLIIVFPTESSKSYYIADYIWTWVCLTLSILFILAGFSGRNFLKYLLFLLASGVTAAICWYIYFLNDVWGALVAVWGGAPAGIITALIFFVLRYYIFFHRKVAPVEKRKKNILLLKQAGLYFLILLIVSIIFENGGDWMFYLFYS